ncbi:GNAT family N-acetyltransferase [Streptomyces sp. NPDC008150]|uniref:GNAT family N-acetyltransferase n=1 Tax=Streptomyces sp. NPDC008150 TaxID=3364816 RepID=UPI0036EB463F
MSDLRVRPATPADRPVVERLWAMFQHDLSEYRGELPRADGTFRDERLVSAFTEPGWRPYLFTSGTEAGAGAVGAGEHAGRPAGFAFVRGLTGPARILNSFFVVRGARRTGLGARALREIVAAHPGTWEIAFQDANAPAARFWPRAVGAIVGDAWTKEYREVPGRPEIAPDSWITFRAG